MRGFCKHVRQSEVFFIMKILCFILEMTVGTFLLQSANESN